jgi:hypothetical protein
MVAFLGFGPVEMLVGCGVVVAVAAFLVVGAIYLWRRP